MVYTTASVNHHWVKFLNDGLIFDKMIMAYISFRKSSLSEISSFRDLCLTQWQWHTLASVDHHRKVSLSVATFRTALPTVGCTNKHLLSLASRYLTRQCFHTYILIYSSRRRTSFPTSCQRESSVETLRTTLGTTLLETNLFQTYCYKSSGTDVV